MTGNQDQPILNNIALIAGILVVMIAFYILVARFFVLDGRLYPEYTRDNTASITAPVGKVRLIGQEPEPAAAVAAAPVATVPEPAPATPISVVDTGQRVYNSLCFSCHSTGLPKVPQLGKAADWANRSGDSELLYEHALQGFTGDSGIMMPAKGGNPALSDDEVRAAVDYMVSSGN